MMMTSNWAHGVGHFFVIHILLHIAVRALTTCSPALISSAGILLTPADFPF